METLSSDGDNDTRDAQQFVQGGGTKARMRPGDISLVFGLTYRQAVFVANYLEYGYRATRAALMSGYSPKHARQSAYQVIHSPNVRHAIDTLFNYYMAQEFGPASQ